MSAVTDEELLPRLVERDAGAFRLLVERYHRPLRTVACSLVGEAFADEVVQDAWISVYRSIDRFERRSSLKTWLYTIVSNRAKSRLKRESRAVSVDPAELAGEYPAEGFQGNGHWRVPPSEWEIDTPERLLEESELQRCIQKTLQILPPMQKSVFLLRDMNQCDFAEICNILDISDSNVRVLLHRARHRLLGVIDHYQETGEC